MSQSHEGQNLSNHKQFIPGYHYFLLSLALAALIGSFVNLTVCIRHSEGLYSASLICALSLMCMVGFVYMRTFALKVQDRAIRAEENFRYFILTGKPLPAGLRMGQIIALRFASDAEFVALCSKALAENMKPADIKKSITSWRGDYHRA